MMNVQVNIGLFIVLITLPCILPWTAAASCSASIASTSPITVTYEIDAPHTYVGFRVRHLGVSEVEGRFPDVFGVLTFDLDDCTTLSAEVRIRATSLVTNDDLRDRRLKDEAFLDVWNYPYLRFKSKRTEKLEKGCGVVGDLTIRETAREIYIPFTWIQNEDHLQIQGEATFNRTDYNLHFDPMMDLLVGREVKLVLDVAMVRSDT